MKFPNNAIVKQMIKKYIENQKKIEKSNKNIFLL